ncbi:DPP IV N-terminal domain-containing protein [Clostridium sp. 'deep sea']|uniref:S9 family peptidase n=1 Tax=Clostridium sp. 'deep sea' TaxID=2779445 RepID=UPI0018969DD3|nr:DPP IV N-terminal domain-containing protein [Clostridium sp. 'deep sea']QOR35210.1 DPP IV N-terminal domain-containing protein [Clostridium sp. 'deep sea']
MNNNARINDDMLKKYCNAEKMLKVNYDKMVFNYEVTPNWFEQSDRFWYCSKSKQGKKFYIVNPTTASKQLAFDHQKLAKALCDSQVECDEHNLPFDSFGFLPDGKTISFQIGLTPWTYNTESSICNQGENIDMAALMSNLYSPDQKWALTGKGYNLYLKSMATGEETALTTDGEEGFEYGTLSGTSLSNASFKRMGVVLPPFALWSKDAKKVVTHRIDERKVPKSYLLQGTPATSDHSNVWHYREPWLGEEMPTAELVVFDVETKKTVWINMPPVYPYLATPFMFKQIWWADDNETLYCLREERGYKKVELYKINTVTGQAKIIMQEESNTFIDIVAGDLISKEVTSKVVNNDSEIIWYSERDGWGHLYLYNAHTGVLKNQITKGEWVVREIAWIDEENRVLYFLAGGKEEGRDPYLRHLYRINFDGTGMKLLTPENAEHRIMSPDGFLGNIKFNFSPSKKYFVDTFSRADLPSTTVVRDIEGNLIIEVEKADVKLLQEFAWTPAEPFKVKARDGVTDIYGVIYRPSNFDCNKKYPVIDDIYPGPQMTRVQKHFGPQTLGQHPEAIAELGFIVVCIDASGSPNRSKAFHDACYGNLKDAGLPDHIAAIKQLAEKYSYIDLDKVGIYGHSSGGYAAMRAILDYSDFYKVCVASAWYNNPVMVNAMWGEKYMGLHNEDKVYKENGLLEEVHKLQGKLLLGFAELDENANYASFSRMVDALVKANKDFDIVYLPNTTHLFIQDPYFTRRKMDFFVKNLLGVEPPKEFRFNSIC